MPRQDPAKYAAMLATYPETEEVPYKQRTKKKTSYPGIEKLVVTGCDPRYEVYVRDHPLLAAERFNIRLTRNERKLLEWRPRAIAVAINAFCWSKEVSGLEKLLMKASDVRQRELITNDPLGAARKFKFKISDSDAILLGNIRRRDLNLAINAAANHLLKHGKPVPGHRLRLQQGRWGRMVFPILGIVEARQQDSADEKKRMQQILTDLFDPEKPLPPAPHRRAYMGDNEIKSRSGRPLSRAKRRKMARRRARLERRRKRRQKEAAKSGGRQKSRGRRPRGGRRREERQARGRGGRSFDRGGRGGGGTGRGGSGRRQAGSQARGRGSRGSDRNDRSRDGDNRNGGGRGRGGSGNGNYRRSSGGRDRDRDRDRNDRDRNDRDRGGSRGGGNRSRSGGRGRSGDRDRSYAGNSNGDRNGGRSRGGRGGSSSRGGRGRGGGGGGGGGGRSGGRGRNGGGGGGSRRD